MCHSEGNHKYDEIFNSRKITIYFTVLGHGIKHFLVFLLFSMSTLPNTQLGLSRFALLYYRGHYTCFTTVFFIQSNVQFTIYIHIIVLCYLNDLN